MFFEYWKVVEKELFVLFKIFEIEKDYVVIENVEEWDDDDK